MPEVHVIGKGLDPNIKPEKQVMKPIAVTKVKEVFQIKLRLGQGRAGLRCKIRTQIFTLISKPIAQVVEKLVEQPKLPVSKISRRCDKIVLDYAIPHISSGDDSSSRMIKRKTIQGVIREIPIYSDPSYRPLLKQ